MPVTRSGNGGRNHWIASKRHSVNLGCLVPAPSVRRTSCPDRTHLVPYPAITSTLTIRFRTPCPRVATPFVYPDIQISSQPWHARWPEPASPLPPSTILLPGDGRPKRPGCVGAFSPTGRQGQHPRKGNRYPISGVGGSRSRTIDRAGWPMRRSRAVGTSPDWQRLWAGSRGANVTTSEPTHRLRSRGCVRGRAIGRLRTFLTDPSKVFRPPPILFLWGWGGGGPGGGASCCPGERLRPIEATIERG